MFGRFFKNKDDGSSKSGPPGHRGSQPGSADAASGGGAAPEPVGGGFFNLPPPVAKGPGAYGGAPSAGGSQPGGGAPSQYGHSANAGGSHHTVPTYGAPQPPQYGQSQPPPYGNHAAPPAAAGGGGMDMFGGMSLKAPVASSSGYGGAPQGLKPSPIKYGGYGASHHDAAPSQPPGPPTGGSLFSGLDLAPGGAAAAPLGPSGAAHGHEDEIVRPGPERKKSGGRGGTFNYLDVAAGPGGGDPAAVQRQSIGPGVGAITRPGASKTVKKKKTKSFRPGFGRQLSDESIAALQRGDLNAEDVMQQHHGTEETVPQTNSKARLATNATDLAHLLPPVKGGSVLAGLTVHEGGSTASSSGGSVLAGLTVHGGNSPRGSSKSSPPSSEGGVLAGLNVHRKQSVDEQSDASTSVVLPSSSEKTPASKKKNPPLEPEKPAAPPTPEEKLMNTLRDFHASAVSFRDSTLKQNEEENKILERKIQLAKQLTQYEIDLRTIEAQQQQAVEVEDFEKADALNSTINSVRHCITLSESDVRKVDSELVAFVKAKEKAFTNQLRSTRGTLKELEKFRDDQDSERGALREELKKYEVEQTEHLQFEADRIETELSHVSSNMDHLKSEKEEIEATIEDQCKNEITLREELLIEKAGVHEEILELQRQLDMKMEQMRGIQASIDKAEKDIDSVRSRYSRQLKRIADREDGLLKTKTEVEADAEQLKEERKQYADTIQDYGARIAAFGKRMKTVKKEMRAAMLLATVLEVQETRREQATVRRKQHTAELTALADSAAIAEQSFVMLRKQREDLEKSLTVHHNAIASAQAMIPQLEQEKKAAASQRNFKEAARISKDIKALEKDQSTAEEMVEVVEMELQDLKERIEKREAEYEEKKEELKTVEKQLELNTLHELWKEAKSLRRSLRKFDKVKSDGIAAADGVDFRSSALLLVQAEYDACIAQVEALERKYDLTDPTAEEDEEVEEDEEEDDESVDEEPEEQLQSPVVLTTSDLVVSAGVDTRIGSVRDAPANLEDIAQKMSELERLIEQATENEEYERAAKLDEQLETLREREALLKARAGSAHSLGTSGSDGAAQMDTSNDHEDLEDHEEGDEEGNTPEELEDELRLIRARIKMLEADIERDTENEDYEAAAELEEELQQLREEESEIVQLLADSTQVSQDASASVNGAPAGAEVTNEGMGLFTGLGMGTGEASADSMFAGMQVPASAPEAATTTEDSMFAGMQVGASAAQAEETTDVANQDDHDEEPSSAISPKETPVSPRRLSVGSGPNSPRRKSSIGMFSGLQVTSAPVDSPRKSSDSKAEGTSDIVTLPMFDGLQLGSSSISVDDNVSAVHVAMPDQTNATNEISGSLFGGLTLTEKADETTNSDDGVMVNVEEATEDDNTPAQEVQIEEHSTEDVSAEANSETTEATSSPVDMFGGLSLASTAVTTDSSVEHPETNSAMSVEATTTSTDIFGGLSLTTTAATTDVATEESVVDANVSETVVEPEAPTSPVDMFGGLSLAPAATVTKDVAKSAE